MCKISFVHKWWGTRSRLFHFSFAHHWLTAFDHYFDYNVHITIQFFWCSLLGDLYHHKWDKFQSLRIWKIIHMQYGYSVYILQSYPLQKYPLVSLCETLHSILACSRYFWGRYIWRGYFWGRYLWEKSFWNHFAYVTDTKWKCELKFSKWKKIFLIDKRNTYQSQHKWQG